ncbi:MAG: hypothetical protein GX444_06950 [Myxococcales bacterium]|nr:hypothetical protein [Myxococcales bacterium]
MKKLLFLTVFAVLVGATLAQASFTAGPTSPVAASRPGAAVVGGKAYVMGGETAKAYSNQIHIFDFAANTWSTSAATMPTGLSNICVTSYDNKIYVVGGYTGATGSNTL